MWYNAGWRQAIKVLSGNSSADILINIQRKLLLLKNVGVK